MDSAEVIQAFREAGALLEGHFVYASGRHGNQFLQASRVLQYPEHTERLCAGMADRFRGDGIELVVGPATGGIILAYATARHLGARAAFTEKEADGSMAIKRGIAVPRGVRTLVVEDIVTTGGSVHKTIAHLEGRGAEVAGVAVLIDRSGGKASFSCRFEALAALDMASYPADALPEWLAALPATEPDDLLA